jgi:glycosyltransferase involved in cell wall biosynthesis
MRHILQSNMRLLLSAYACRPNAGSEPGCGWNWATHLAARGLEVHVLVAQRNQEVIEAGLRTAPIPNLHFTYVAVPYPWARRSEALHYVCWQRAALRAAKELASKFRFHVVHHVTYASVHVPTPLWRLGLPVVFGPIGGGQTAPASMLKYFGPNKYKEQLRTVLTQSLKISPFHKYVLRQMDFILAANRDTLNAVKALGCENACLMCDTAIAGDYFAKSPRKFEHTSDPLKLLWVGRMLPRKALSLALDALQKVSPSITMTIAGDGLDPRVVRQMIAKRGLEQRVFWKGVRLTLQELRTAYSEHDAMLFTSLRDSFGSQVLEALAMGLPVITLDLHGAHDFVPEAASLKVPVGDPHETVQNLAKAIEEYASLPQDARENMSKQAWYFAKRVTWSARAEFADNLYRDLCSRSIARQNTRASQLVVADT